MRIQIIGVGRLKEAEERAIVDRYCRRLEQVGRARGLGPVTEVELAECRLPTPDQRKSEEAGRLLTAAGTSYTVALDEHGRMFSSAELAALLGQRADGATKCCTFLIGGPDGHGAEVLSKADLCLSLSTLTLPHGLARAVLTEQLYRAATIMTGHPYHRS